MPCSAFSTLSHITGLGRLVTSVSLLITNSRRGAFGYAAKPRIRMQHVSNASTHVPKTRYDWEHAPVYWTKLDRFSGCGALLENRAAMFWGRPWHGHVPNVPHDASVILGYNEPNNREQSNMTAKEAALHWPAIQRQAGNRTLVAPCPVREGHPQTYFEWMDEFLHHCRGCHMDYLATHIYECDANAEMAFLEQIYRKYKKKIWVTEFACPYVDSPEVQLDYMKSVLPRLEAAHFVVRYAWFSARLKGDWYIPKAASLMEPHSSKLTALGEYYLNFQPGRRNVGRPLYF